MADKQLWEVTPVATDVKNDDGVIIGGQTAGTRYAPLTLIANFVHNLWAAFINALTAKTSFASGDKIPVVNGSTATAMSKDTLLELTAQNALAGNVAPLFNPSKPNDENGYAYYAGTNVTHEGKNYVFIVNHPSGAWNPAEVEQRPLSESINTEGVGEAVAAWLDEHPEATTSVEDGSLTEPKFSNSLKLKAIKDYVTPEMFGAKGDGVTDDTEALAAAAEKGKPVIGMNDKTYLITEYVTFTNSVYNLKVLVGADGSDLVFDSLKNKEIVGVSIDYDKKVPYQHRAALYVIKSVNLSIRNVLVENVGNNTANFGRAIRFKDGCDNVLVENTIVQNVESSSLGAASGILVSNNETGVTPCSNITISGCSIRDIYPDNDADGVIVIDGGTSVYNSNIIVSNCKFEGCTKRAIKFQSKYCKSINNVIQLTKPCYACIDFQRGYGQSINDTIIIDYDNESQLIDSTYIARMIVLFSGPNSRCEGLKVSSSISQPTYNYCVYVNKNLFYDNLDNIDIVNSSFENCEMFLYCENNVTSLSNLNINGVFTNKLTARSSSCFWFSSATMDKVKIHGNFYGAYQTFLGSRNAITNGDIDIVGFVQDRYFCNDTSNRVRVRTVRPYSESYISGYDYFAGQLTLYLYKGSIGDNQGYDVLRLAWNTPAGAIVKCSEITYSAGNPIKIGYVCNTAGTGNKTGNFTPITVATA